jgi:uncharacterized alpha-E superfamily protein
MLSRTADSLYWTARYLERADFVARILDAALRFGSLPSTYGGGGEEWESAVAVAGDANDFYARYDRPDERSVIQFLAFDRDNASSIHACLTAARANARAVRTALTGEMWEGINGAWNELQRFDGRRMNGETFAGFLEWVKRVSLMFDGGAYRTMLRNDAYWFLRLGVAVERADNTARILDVKYHLLLPEREPVGGGLDYFQWTTILREVSALTAFHWVYRDSVKPWLVADLLILNRQMPRSLASCYGEAVRRLDQLSGYYGRRGAAQRLAGSIQARIDSQRIDDIFQSGLHEFISGFLRDNAQLGAAIADQYLS